MTITEALCDIAIPVMELMWRTSTTIRRFQCHYLLMYHTHIIMTKTDTKNN